jgi:hypothetical protein
MIVVELGRNRRARSFGLSLELPFRFPMVLDQPAREGLHPRIVSPVGGEPRFLDREKIGVRGAGHEVEFGAEVGSERKTYRQDKTDDADRNRQVHTLASRALCRAIL